MYICICHAVNESRIQRAAQDGVRNIKGLCRSTGAGTCCGKCLPEAKRILDRSVATLAENALASNALIGNTSASNNLIQAA